MSPLFKPEDCSPPHGTIAALSTPRALQVAFETCLPTRTMQPSEVIAEPCPHQLQEMLEEEYAVVVPLLQWVEATGVALPSSVRQGLNGVLLCCNDPSLLRSIADETSDRGDPPMSHSESLTRCIKELLFSKQVNLLTYGYRVARDGDTTSVGSLLGISCFYPNSNVTFLNGPAWRQLHDTIGSARFSSLLRNVSLFVYPGQGRGLWQVTGKPFHKVIPQRSSYSRLPPPDKGLSLLAVSHRQRFSHHPGFSRSHSLSQFTRPETCGSPSLTQRAKALILHIFAQEPAAQRFPKRLVRSVPLFERLLSRFPVLQRRIGKALAYWAPLPPQMKEFQRRMRGTASHPRATDSSSQGSSDGGKSQSSASKSVATLPSVWSQPIAVKHSALSSESSATPAPHSHECKDSMVEGAPSVLGFAVSPQQVECFVVECVKRLVPAQLLGGQQGFRSLRQCIRVIVRSGVRDVLNFHDLQKKFKRAHFEWIRPRVSRTGHRSHGRDEQHTQFRLLQKWVQWLLSSLVCPLLELHFYICTTEPLRRRAVYFRKPVWASISYAFFQKIRQELHLVPVNSRGTAPPAALHVAEGVMGAGQGQAEFFAGGHALKPLGVASIRLVPKTSGVRPIMNLSKRLPPPGTSNVKAIQSMNSMLSVLHEVLKNSRKEQPQDLGSSIFGLDGIHDVWRGFVQQYYERYRGTALHSRPPLYFVSLDVSHAYDSITKEKLLSLMRPKFHQPEYLEGRLVLVSHRNMDASTQPQKRRKIEPPTKKRHAQPVYKTHIQRFLGDPLETGGQIRRSRCDDYHIFCDTVVRNRHTDVSLQRLLERHLSAHIVDIGGTKYHQGRGIPQGSVVSSILCNYYFADMERTVLLPTIRAALQNETGGDRDKTKPLSCLMRLTDDFLFVSESKAAAQAFAQRLCAGVPEYGTTVNPHKARVNFHVEVTPPEGAAVCLPRFDVPAAAAAAAPLTAATALRHREVWAGLSPLHALHARSLLWCGLRIDPLTLQISGDYTRYLPPARLSDFLAVPSRRQTWLDVRTTLLHFLRPKCHAVLLDPSMNGLDVQVLNVYHMMALAMLKLLTLLRHHRDRSIALPQLQRFPEAVKDAVDGFSSLITSVYHKRCGVMTQSPPSDVALKGELTAKRQKIERCSGPRPKRLQSHQIHYVCYRAIHDVAKHGKRVGKHSTVLKEFFSSEAKILQSQCRTVAIDATLDRVLLMELREIEL